MIIPVYYGIILINIWSFNLIKDIPTEKMYEKITEWLTIYHSSNDKIMRERAKTYIVTQMYPVVRRIAKTIARRSTDPIEDMIQAGFIGLLKAVDKYNIEKNNNFRIYAGYLIIGEMKHYLRDKLNTIRVPRHIQELSVRINNFTKDLTDEEVNNITSEEIASALNTTTNAIETTLQVERRRTTISLEEVFDTSVGNLNYEEILTDDNYSEKSSYEDARIMFETVIEKLPPNQRIIIEMYYKKDMSVNDISNALNITKSSVSRRLKRACEKMADLIIKDKAEFNEGIE